VRGGIAAIWSEVLGVPRAGVHDSFFDLGRPLAPAGHAVDEAPRAPRDGGLGEGVPGGPHHRGDRVQRGGRSRCRAGARAARVPPPAVARDGDRAVPDPPGRRRRALFRSPRAAPAGVLVFGIQSPGLLGEQAPLGSLEEMAAHYVRAMRAVQPQGPYSVAGWSLGAHLALEVSWQLRAQGEEVALCALIDGDPAAGAAARQGIPPEAFEDNALCWTTSPSTSSSSGAGRSPSPWRAGRACPGCPGGGVRRGGAGTAAASGSPDDGGQLRRVVDVFKANMRALMNHVPREYDGPLTLIEAERSIAHTQLVRSGCRRGPRDGRVARGSG